MTNSISGISVTKNVMRDKKYKSDTLHQHYDYQEIPAIGDGNCLFNAYALGLIDLAKRRQLLLNAGAFLKLRQAITHPRSMQTLKNRLALYRGDKVDDSAHRYSDLAQPLAAFIQWVEANPEFPLADLEKRLTDANTREAIAALHVALAPALRMLGVAGYKADLEHIEARSLEVELDDLQQDNTHAGYECAIGLSKQLNLNVALFNTKSPNGDTVSAYDHSSVDDSPTIALLYKNQGGSEHWNFLSTLDQHNWDCLPSNEDGVMQASTGKRKMLELPPSNNHLLDELPAVKPQEIQALIAQEWNLNSAEKTKYQEGLKLATDLIMHDLTTHDEAPAEMSDDAALAKQLQQLEIQAFLEKHHATLYHKKLKSTEAITEDSIATEDSASSARLNH